MDGITEFLQKQAGKNVSEAKKVNSAPKKLRKGPKMDITAFLRKEDGKDPFEGVEQSPRRRRKLKGTKMDITAFLRKQEGKDPFEGLEQRTPQRRRMLSDEERRLQKISKIREAIGNMSSRVRRMMSTDADPIATCYLAKLQKVLFDGNELFCALEKGEIDEKKLLEYL